VIPIGSRIKFAYTLKSSVSPRLYGELPAATKNTTLSGAHYLAVGQGLQAEGL
jgi:hypothetical protein